MKDIKWEELTIPQKKVLFIKYIERILKINENKYHNEIIDNLTYSKNKFFLDTLKKERNFLRNLKNDDIIIENNEIHHIKTVKKNDNNLIYCSNNKNINKQLKITDYNYPTVKDYVNYEEKNKNESKDV